jgi:hypothetical protein
MKNIKKIFELQKKNGCRDGGTLNYASLDEASLDDASLGLCIPWMMHPLDVASLQGRIIQPFVFSSFVHNVPENQGHIVRFFVTIILVLTSLNIGTCHPGFRLYIFKFS